MKGRTQTYLDSHPAARRRKRRYDAKFNRKPSEVRKRTLLNRENRRRGTYGNGDGKDLSHTKRGLVYKDERVNRGSTKDAPGDRRARGRRKRRR